MDDQLAIDTTPGEGITALAFSSDNDTVYASSPHVPLQSYPITPAHAVAWICTEAGGSLSPAQWSTYIPGIAYRGEC